MKVRYYGCMHANCAVPQERLSALIEMASGFAIAPVPDLGPHPPPPLVCPHCGGLLIYRWTLRPCPRSP